MTFAGYFSFDDPEFSEAQCRKALAGFSHIDIRASGPTAFGLGSGAGETAASDGVASLNDHLMIVGEICLFDPDLLRARIGGEAERVDPGRHLDIVVLAWARWGEDCLEFLRGDYAFALWDRRIQRLFLVRGPLSASSLFYFTSKAGVALASDRTTLLRMPSVGRALDLETAARFMAGLPFPGDQTMFSGVRRLSHSQIVTIGKGHRRDRTFWRPARQNPRRGSPDDIAAELVSVLERSVARRIHDRATLVSSQLSSGRDSGAVTVTAAGLLGRTDERLLVLTAAPSSSGYYTPEGWTGDESASAAATASLYANVDHQIVRSSVDPLYQLEEAQALLPDPVGHVSNFPWGRDLHLAAQARGSTLMLAAGVGNLTVSEGGPAYLPAVLRECGFAKWWALARANIHGPFDLVTTVNRTFGGLLPSGLHQWSRQLLGRSENDMAGGARFLRPAYRQDVARAFRQEVADLRPPRDPFDRQAEMIMAQDPTDYLSRTLWGVAVRDPTADRDLADFCFSVPVNHLVGSGDSRPLFEKAFAKSLGWTGNSSRPRGYQGADWYRALDRPRVEELLRRHGSHDLVRELLDLSALEALCGAWPGRWDSRSQLHLYRNYLLGAVSLAQFIAINF